MGQINTILFLDPQDIYLCISKVQKKNYGGWFFVGGWQEGFTYVTGEIMKKKFEISY